MEKKLWSNAEVVELGVKATKDERLFECSNPVGNNKKCPIHNHLCKYATSDVPVPYDNEKCIGNHVVRCTAVPLIDLVPSTPIS